MLNVKVHENTSIACFEWLLGESLFSLKRAWQHNFGVQSCIWTNHQTSATMSFGYCPTCMRLLPRTWVSASIFQSIVQYPYTAVYLLLNKSLFSVVFLSCLSLCVSVYITLYRSSKVCNPFTSPKKKGPNLFSLSTFTYLFGSAFIYKVVAFSSYLQLWTDRAKQADRGN